MLEGVLPTVILIIVGLAAVAFLVCAIVIPVKKVSKKPSDQVPAKASEAEGKAMTKKYRIWVVVVPALAIIVTIAIRPMYWLGSIGFGWTMFWLVVAVGMLAAYEWLSNNRKSAVQSLRATLVFLALVAGIVVAGVLLKTQQPELTAGEVKTIMNMWLKSDYRAVSAEYRGEGTWWVRTIGKESGLLYVVYSERDGKVIDIVE